MFRRKVVKKIETHFTSSIFFPENHAIYEITWKTSVEPGGPQITVCNI